MHIGHKIKLIKSVLHRISKSYELYLKHIGKSSHISDSGEMKLFTFFSEIFRFLNLIKIPEEGDIYSQMKNMF